MERWHAGAGDEPTNMSTQTKHTPGPWEAYPHSKEPVTTIIGNRTDGIAKVLASGNRDLDDANARLIAAAPSMLEALKQAAFAIPTTHGAFDSVNRAIKLAIGQ